ERTWGRVSVATHKPFSSRVRFGALEMFDAAIWLCGFRAAKAAEVCDGAPVRRCARRRREPRRPPAGEDTRVQKSPAPFVAFRVRGHGIVTRPGRAAG